MSSSPTFGDERRTAEEVRRLRLESRESTRSSRGSWRKPSRRHPVDDLGADAGALDQEGQIGKRQQGDSSARDIAALMNLVGHTNYPAMVELFLGSGAPPAGSDTDVHVSFELFESVQNRAAATRDELEQTKIELQRTKERVMLLQGETGILKDRVASLERQYNESEKHNEQLRQISLDASLLRDQHEIETQALRDEVKAAYERVDKLNGQLTEANYKVSDSHVQLAQRDSLIANLRRERDELIRKQKSRDIVSDAQSKKPQRKSLGGGGEDADGGDGMKRTESSMALLRLRDAAKQVSVTHQLNAMKHTLSEIDNARKEALVDLRNAKAKLAASKRRRVVDLERNERELMLVHDIWSSHVCAAATYDDLPATDQPAGDQETSESNEKFTASTVLKQLEDMTLQLRSLRVPRSSRFFSELDTSRDSVVGLSQTAQECLRLMHRFQIYLAEAVTINEVKSRWGRIEQPWFKNVRDLAAGAFKAATLVMERLVEKESTVVGEVDAEADKKWEAKIAKEYTKKQPMGTVATMTFPPDGATVECQAGPAFYADREDKQITTNVIRGCMQDVETGVVTDVDYKIPDWILRITVPPAELQAKPRELFDAFPRHLLVLHVRIVELAMALRKVLGITAAIADPTAFMKKLNLVPTIQDAYEIVHFDEELVNTLLSSMLISKDEATQRLLNFKRKSHHYSMERTIQEQQAAAAASNTASPAGSQGIKGGRIGGSRAQSTVGGKPLSFQDRQAVADFKMRKSAIESEINRADGGHERLQQAVEEKLYGDEQLRMRMAQGAQTKPKQRQERGIGPGGDGATETDGNGGGAFSVTGDSDSVSQGTSSAYGSPSIPRGNLDNFDWGDVRRALANSSVSAAYFTSSGGADFTDSFDAAPTAHGGGGSQPRGTPPPAATSSLPPIAGSLELPNFSSPRASTDGLYPQGRQTRSPSTVNLDSAWMESSWARQPSTPNPAPPTNTGSRSTAAVAPAGASGLSSRSKSRGESISSSGGSAAHGSTGRRSVAGPSGPDGRRKSKEPTTPEEKVLQNPLNVAAEMQRARSPSTTRPAHQPWSSSQAGIRVSPRQPSLDLEADAAGSVPGTKRMSSTATPRGSSSQLPPLQLLNIQGEGGSVGQGDAHGVRSVETPEDEPQEFQEIDSLAVTMTQPTGVFGHAGDTEVLVETRGRKRSSGVSRSPPTGARRRSTTASGPLPVEGGRVKPQDSLLSVASNSSTGNQPQQSGLVILGTTTANPPAAAVQQKNQPGKPSVLPAAMHQRPVIMMTARGFPGVRMSTDEGEQRQSSSPVHSPHSPSVPGQKGSGQSPSSSSLSPAHQGLMIVSSGPAISPRTQPLVPSRGAPTSSHSSKKGHVDGPLQLDTHQLRTTDERAHRRTSDLVHWLNATKEDPNSVPTPLSQAPSSTQKGGHGVPSTPLSTTSAGPAPPSGVGLQITGMSHTTPSPVAGGPTHLAGPGHRAGPSLSPAATSLSAAGGHHPKIAKAPVWMPMQVPVTTPETLSPSTSLSGLVGVAKPMAFTSRPHPEGHRNDGGEKDKVSQPSAASSEFGGSGSTRPKRQVRFHGVSTPSTTHLTTIEGATPPTQTSSQQHASDLKLPVPVNQMKPGPAVLEDGQQRQVQGTSQHGHGVKPMSLQAFQTNRSAFAAPTPTASVTGAASMAATGRVTGHLQQQRTNSPPKASTATIGVTSRPLSQQQPKGFGGYQMQSFGMQIAPHPPSSARSAKKPALL